MGVIATLMHLHVPDDAQRLQTYPEALVLTYKYTNVRKKKKKENLLFQYYVGKTNS